MIPLRLFLDARPGRLPKDTYPYGKNGIQFDLNGTTFNEPGFLDMDIITPYTHIGTIETDSKPVVMSTDGTNSAIGFFNTFLQTYEPIIDDNPSNRINWPDNGERLGFSLEKYITGEAQRNYKGELVIAFTDKDKFPKYVNCDNPDITRLDDLRLFPYFSPPIVTLTESIGGSLSAGTYYVAVGYERNDGTSTPYSEVSQGITIRPGDLGNSSDKSVLITVSRADTSFDFMRVAVISRVNGRTTTTELTEWVPVTGGSVDVLYTGDNITNAITVEEILTPPAVYERVGTIGQLNDALYIGNLEREIELITNLQRYVNMAIVKWRSQLIDATSPPVEHVNGQLKGFMHEEVYALYVRFHKTRGGYTKAFTLPALPLLAAYGTTSAEATAGGAVIPVPRFKVEDCIPFFDNVTKTGYCGTFLNGTEEYPDHDEFNSITLGGRDLREVAVHHHKMPSLRWCKNNLYSSVPEYGKTKLDLLTLELTNLTLPSEYDGLIDGYELLYAKRTPANMTVYGQAPLLHGAVPATEVAVPTGNANVYTTGGNWRSGIVHKGKGDYDDDWELTQLRQDTMRIHPFDVLLNKPSIEPTYISAQYKLRKDRLKTEGYLEDGAQDGDHNMPTVHLIDYTQGINPIAISAGQTLRRVKDSFYLNIGVTVGRFNNVRHETAFAGTLAGTNWPLNHGEMAYRIRGTSYTEQALISDFEETYMVNLIAVKEDLYSNFYSQRLVSAGPYKAIDDFSPFKGGDTFVCDYTYHTYGRHDRIDTEGEGFKGKKVIRRVVCESASNIHLRYEIPANEYSRWYPRTGIAYNNPDQTYITRFDRSKDPNQFGYSRDLNALNDFVSSTIYNPFSEEITIHPYRIHRLGKLSRQNKPRSWRTALPLDYYECQKNMGVITNLAGMYDRLIIHHENAMFLTQPRAQLEAGLLSVTLGPGDIFKFEPQEAQQSKLGYAGTVHDLACVKTPVGYVFPDAKQGELYLWDGEKLHNLHAGLNTFFRQYLKLADRNSYTGNGITIGWDQKYKRILLTVKNVRPTNDEPDIKLFEDTNDFFNDLVEGDIINYYGRYIRYMGLNNSEASGFDCEPPEAGRPLLEWRPYVFGCEDDSNIVIILPTPVPEEFEELSSPAVMLYNNESGQMYVGDHDQSAGNFYRIDLETGDKTYFGSSFIGIYSLLKDRDTMQIYGSGVNDGLFVFNTETEEVTTVEYGSDVVLSRVGLWIVGDNIIARDMNTNTLTFIDRNTLAVVATKNIGSDIPSGSTWLNSKFDILDVDGNAWIIPTQRGTAGIAIYSGDFTTLIDTITIPGITVVPDWGGDVYWQSGFYDNMYGVVYVHDSGSGKTYVLDKVTQVVVHTFTWVNRPDTDRSFMNFYTDPVNDRLYLAYRGKEDDGITTTDVRVYVVDRGTRQVLRLFMDAYLYGPLEREGATDYMWTPVPGNKSWEGGSWSSDGYILKLAHSTGIIS